MNSPNRRYRWLLWLAIGSVTLLAMLPLTGWLVRTQFQSELMLSGTQTDTAALARQHPSDYLLQYADALQLRKPPTTQGVLHGDPYARSRAEKTAQMARLNALSARFPENPAPYAQILRYRTLSGIMHINRQEADGQLGMSDKPGFVQSAANSPSPEKYIEFARVAGEGERADPDNAFFPFMRSVGLYGTHQDAEAIAAILRAGTKGHWDDYALDDAKAGLHADELTSNSRDSLSRLLQLASVLLPHYVSMGEAARFSTYEANAAERRGDMEQGLAIRHAVMRYGSLMRAQSVCAIGSRFGSDIVITGMAFPGGEAYSKNSEKDDYELQLRKLRGAYMGYLQQTGHDDEAQWASTEFERDQQAGAIVAQAAQQSSLLRDVSRITSFVVLAGFVLSNILVLLFLGGAAYLASRFKSIQHVGWARMAFGFVLVSFLLVWQTHVFNPETNPALSVGTSANMIEVMRNLGCQALPQNMGFKYLPWLANGLINFSDPQNANLFAIVSVALGLLVPGLVVLGLAVASWRLRVPVAAGIGRGLSGLAIPIALCLTLAYCGLATVASVYNLRLNTQLDRSMVHEGRAMAESVHRIWPGL